MTNTVRRALVWTMNGEYQTRRQAKTLHAARKRTRKLDRRQQSLISREAIANYYDDLSWIERFEAEIEAREAEFYYGHDWDVAIEEWQWREWEDAEMYDIHDDWTGAAEYEWLDRQMSSAEARDWLETFKEMRGFS